MAYHQNYPIPDYIILEQALKHSSKGSVKTSSSIEMQNLKWEMYNFKTDLDRRVTAVGTFVNSAIQFDASEMILSSIGKKTRASIDVRHTKKLWGLYDDKGPLKSGHSKVVNLTDFLMDNEMRDILNLGMNCHLKENQPP